MVRDIVVMSPFENNDGQYVLETVFEDFNEDTGTANNIRKRAYKLSELLKGAKSKARSDIRKFTANAEQIEMALGIVAYGGRNNDEADCYAFNTADVIHICNFCEMRNINYSYSIAVGNEIYLIANVKPITVTRLFTVHHYNMEGHEQWYINHSGLRMKDAYGALYCSKRLASNAKRYKAKYDGCANVVEHLIIQ